MKKMLIVDCGPVDGQRMGRFKQVHHIGFLVPLRTNMDGCADAIGLTPLPGFQWEPRKSLSAPPPSPLPPKPARVAKLVLLAYTLLQARLLPRQRLNPLIRTSILDLLTPTLEVVAVCYQQRFSLLSLPEFAIVSALLGHAVIPSLSPSRPALRPSPYPQHLNRSRAVGVIESRLPPNPTVLWVNLFMRLSASLVRMESGYDLRTGRGQGGIVGSP